MSDPVYVTQLGYGLYMDDQGVMHQGAPPAVPSYVLPGGLLASANEVAKLSKSFKEIGNAMPNQADTDNFRKFSEKLSSLGLPGNDMAQLLGVVGKIANTFGTVFAVAGAVLAVAKMLNLFSEGPSALELLVDKRFDALETQFRSLETLISQRDLEGKKEKLVAARSAIADFVSRRDGGNMTAGQIAAELLENQVNLEMNSSSEFIGLIDPISYTHLFDQQEHFKVWPMVGQHLYTMPGGSHPNRAPFPVSGARVFDHRLAIVLAPQAALGFLTMVRSLHPEFRTTGHFRSRLQDFAEKMSDLAASMRNTSLARTIYNAGDFGLLVNDCYVDDSPDLLDPRPRIIEPVLKPDYAVVVGALDLASHTDAFFPDVAIYGPPPGPSRRGSIEFRWHPPARLVRSPLRSGLFHDDGTPVIEYRIVNAQECADAANEASLQDYSNLLISSGYLTLTQLASQLWHAATQPDKSETVHGEVILQREPQALSEVEVDTGPGPVLFTVTGQIKSRAWREPQKVRAFALCSTQEILRPAPLIHYRVLLRTLPSIASWGSWREPDYSALVQSTSYADDPVRAGLKRLHLVTTLETVLTEHVLAEGSSQEELRHLAPQTLDFKAHTYDWWLPVQPPYGARERAIASNPMMKHVTANASGTSLDDLLRSRPKYALAHERTSEVLSPASVVLGLGWEEGAQTWSGDRRDPVEKDVQMRIQLDWRQSSLRVEIENRPEDRNYVVFLVVEETFGSVELGEQRPKVLHTAFPIHVNGQLTFVPRALFDEEQAARDKQRAFAQKFASSVDPGPGVPVFRTIGIRELATDAGVARLASELRQFRPDILEELTREG